MALGGFTPLAASGHGCLTFLLPQPLQKGRITRSAHDLLFDIVEKHKQKKHMEIVGVLKSEHAMGHGHANAVVAFYLAHNSK
jgi:hypothetical protein